MNDTHSLLDAMVRRLLANVTGEERLRFASDSFEAAKVIVRSSFSDIEDDLVLKKKMFLRFYQHDVNDSFIQGFLDYLVLNDRH